MSSYISILSDKLVRLIDTTEAPTRMDVRIEEGFSADQHLIPAAVPRSYVDVDDWTFRMMEWSVFVVCDTGRMPSEDSEAWLRFPESRASM